MANNNLIYNAALSGASAAMQCERWITDTDSAEYLAARNAAIAFATIIDGQIPFDAAMDQSKADLMQGICSAVLSTKSFVATDVSIGMALAIVAFYNSLVTGLEPIDGGGVAPLSTTLWVDPGTATALADQDGSIGAPYSTIQAAIDAMATIKSSLPEAGTIVLCPGDYLAAAFEWDGSGYATQEESALNFFGLGGCINLGACTIVGDDANPPIVTFTQVGEGSYGSGIASVAVNTGIANVFFDDSVVTGDVNCTAADCVVHARNHSTLAGTVTAAFLLANNSFVDTCVLASGLTAANGAEVGTATTQNAEVNESSISNTLSCSGAGSALVLSNSYFGGAVTKTGAGGTITANNCQFDAAISASNGATFENCRFGSAVASLSSGLDTLTLNDCRFEGATTVDCVTGNFTLANLTDTVTSSGELTLRQCVAGTDGILDLTCGSDMIAQDCELAVNLVTTGNLTSDRKSFDFQRVAGGTISIGGTIIISDMETAAQQLAYDASGPSNVLTLLPAGHTPGIYNVTSPCVVNTASGGGTLTAVFSYNAPTFGATSISNTSIQTNALGGSLVSCRALVSDGSAPITAQMTPVGISGTPSIDVYATAQLMAPLV